MAGQNSKLRLVNRGSPRFLPHLGRPLSTISSTARPEHLADRRQVATRKNPVLTKRKIIYLKQVDHTLDEIKAREDTARRRVKARSACHLPKTDTCDHFNIDRQTLASPRIHMLFPTCRSHLACPTCLPMFLRRRWMEDLSDKPFPRETRIPHQATIHHTVPGRSRPTHPGLLPEWDSIPPRSSIRTHLPFFQKCRWKIPQRHTSRRKRRGRLAERRASLVQSPEVAEVRSIILKNEMTLPTCPKDPSRSWDTARIYRAGGEVALVTES